MEKKPSIKLPEINNLSLIKEESIATVPTELILSDNIVEKATIANTHNQNKQNDESSSSSSSSSSSDDERKTAKIKMPHEETEKNEFLYVKKKSNKKNMPRKEHCRRKKQEGEPLTYDRTKNKIYLVF